MERKSKVYGGWMDGGVLDFRLSCLAFGSQVMGFLVLAFENMVII